METVFDPLRKTDVPLTPEEKVRQWFIGVLMSECSVPAQLMNSEVGFRYGGKRYRADILIWDRNAAAVAVVECKKPSVALGPAVLDQAIRYNMALGLKYLILTNGSNTIVLRKKDSKFVPVNYLPTYDQMLSEQE